MKKIILTFCVLLQIACSFSKAQQKTKPALSTSIEFNFDQGPLKGQEMNGVFDWGQKGWLFFTGKANSYNSTKLQLNLSLYSNDLNLKWSVPIERTVSNNQGRSEIYVSEKQVLHIEYVKQKSMNITAIDIDGKTTIHKIDDAKGLTADEKNTFFLGDNLCFIVYNGEKGEKAKYSLNQIETKSWIVKNIKLELPPIKKEENKYDFWQYIGSEHDMMYFYSKGLITKEKDQKVVYDFVALDGEGKKKRDFKITVKLDENRYIAPCKQTICENTNIPGEFCYNRKKAGGKHNSGGHLVLTPNVGSFSDVFFDKEQLVIYGLYSTEKIYDISYAGLLAHQNPLINYSGIFVQEFTLEGKNSGNTYFNFPGECTAIDKNLNENDIVNNRIYIKSKENGTYNIQIKTKSDKPCIHSFNLDKTGRCSKRNCCEINPDYNYYSLFKCEKIPFVRQAMCDNLSSAEKIYYNARQSNKSNNSVYYSIYSGQKSTLIEAYDETSNKRIFYIASNE